MKKGILLSVIYMVVTMQCFSQNEEVEESGGFKKQNLFTGGSITLSFFNNQTVIGANPIFGYRLANWVDAGLAFNYLYSSAKDYAQYNDKVRQSVFGPGVFTRLYPVRFLFAQAQYEYNFSQLKYIYPAGSPIEKTNVDAPSLLIGGGLAQGRMKGSTTFYYISVLFDVLKDINSPYVSVSFDPNNPSNHRVDIIPIIRAGVNIGLFQGKNSGDGY
jgi:hypothetical protein